MLNVRSKYLFLILTLISCAVYGQSEIEIRGEVSDMDGNPIEATVRFSSGSKSVKEGKFEIFLKKLPDTIRITAIGYETVYRYVARPEYLKIRMSPSHRLIDEVEISTGYQMLKPHETNGAISTVTESMLQSRTGGNILDRLIGHSTGLLRLNNKEASQTSVMVRGMGTINGSIDPIIVLDGFIYDGDIDNINPNDISSVNILKDAAASSIWGARAGNGVIVITTKKGRLNQELNVTFRVDHSLRAIPDLQENFRIGADEHIELERFLFERGHFDNILRTRPWQQVTPVVEILLQQREGKLNTAQVSQRLGFWRAQDQRESYKDEFYKPGHHQNYYVQLSGGGSRNSYSFSGSLDRNSSETYDLTDKINLRITNQFQITDRFSFGVNAQFVSNQYQQGRPAYGSIRSGSRHSDYLAFRDENGIPIPIDIEYRGGYTDSVTGGQLLDWKYYPATNYLHTQNKVNKQDVFGTLHFEYKLFPFLDFTGSYQYQLQQTHNRELNGEESYEARNLINQYSSIHPVTGTVSRVIPVGGVESSRNSAVNSFAWRFQSNFRKSVGRHLATAIVGMELKGSGTSSQMNNTKYGFSEDPLTYSQVDVMGLYPHFITGATGRIGASSSMTRTSYRFVSIYANASYIFSSRYIVSGSMRRDGSNLFGVNTNDRWKPLWSAGFGWDISNEDFYASDLITHLKLTMTYGVSGNVDLTKTSLPIIQYGTNNITGFRFARVRSIHNPDLRWEELSQFSSSLDFKLRRDFMGSVSFFKKRGYDLYGSAPYDFTTWGAQGTIVRNVGNMEGYGLEAEFHSTNYKRGRLMWKTDFYFNWNKDRTTAYHLPNAYSTMYNIMVGAGDRLVTPFVGYPLYSIAGYRWGGLDGEGNPLGYREGGKSNDYTQILEEAAYGDGGNVVYFGSTNPHYFGSLNNTIQYRGLALSFNLIYRLGYFTRKNSINYSQLISNGQGHKDYLNRWQNSGDELTTSIPSFVYPAISRRETFYSNSAVNVIPGDNVRLDYVRLSYTVNTIQWKRPFRDFNVFSGVENCGLVWVKNKEKLDPDFKDAIIQKPLWSIGIKTHF